MHNTHFNNKKDVLTFILITIINKKVFITEIIFFMIIVLASYLSQVFVKSIFIITIIVVVSSYYINTGI